MSKSPPLSPKDKRALQVLGLVLLDAFLGDKKRTLTNMGAPLLLPPNEVEQLHEAMRRADEKTCGMCMRGEHAKCYGTCIGGRCECVCTKKEG